MGFCAVSGIVGAVGAVRNHVTRFIPAILATLTKKIGATKVFTSEQIEQVLAALRKKLKIMRVNELRRSGSVLTSFSCFLA